MEKQISRHATCIAANNCRTNKSAKGGGKPYGSGKDKVVCDGTDCKRFACNHPVCIQHLQKHQETHDGQSSAKRVAGALTAATALVLGLALIITMGGGDSQAAIARTDRLLAQPDHLMLDSERPKGVCGHCKVALGAFELLNEAGDRFCHVCAPLFAATQEISLWSQRYVKHEHAWTPIRPLPITHSLATYPLLHAVHWNMRNFLFKARRPHQHPYGIQRYV